MIRYWESVDPAGRLFDARNSFQVIVSASHTSARSRRSTEMSREKQAKHEPRWRQSAWHAVDPGSSLSLEKYKFMGVAARWGRPSLANGPRRLKASSPSGGFSTVCLCKYYVSTISPQSSEHRVGHDNSGDWPALIKIQIPSGVVAIVGKSQRLPLTPKPRLEGNARHTAEARQTLSLFRSFFSMC